MDIIIFSYFPRCATRAAESKWRLMGANNVAEAKQTFKARIRRSIGVEGARGLARLRLANLSCMFKNTSDLVFLATRAICPVQRESARARTR
jgi:hypothetical protein